jgi:hypothetical protein
METALKQKFGIEAEPVPASGPRMRADCSGAQRRCELLRCHYLRYTSIGLAHDACWSPSSRCDSAEVKDPKQWFGGHVWEDNLSTNKFLYSFLADVSTQNAWFNATMAKAEDFQLRRYRMEVEGKIGFNDPRIPSSGQGNGHSCGKRRAKSS